MSAFRHVANALWLVCAVVITGLLARRELVQSRQPDRQVHQQEMINNWREFAHGNVLGAKDGKTTLVVFSDYECPFCAAFVQRLDSVLAMHPELTVHYRNLPLPMHSGARRAAFAAECAAQQGQFASAHRRLFSGVPQASEWDKFATEVNIRDRRRFTACVRDSLPVGVVRQDLADAARLSIKGTPALLLDGQLIRGAPPLAALDSLVRAASARQMTSRQADRE